MVALIITFMGDIKNFVAAFPNGGSYHYINYEFYENTQNGWLMTTKFMGAVMNFEPLFFGTCNAGSHH